MRIVRGKVVGGRIVVEGLPLNEGSTVTVIVTDEHAFTLNARDEADLLQAITEADQGGMTDGNDVINNIS